MIVGNDKNVDNVLCKIVNSNSSMNVFCFINIIQEIGIYRVYFKMYDEYLCLVYEIYIQNRDDVLVMIYNINKNVRIKNKMEIYIK